MTMHERELHDFARMRQPLLRLPHPVPEKELELRSID